MNCMIGQNVLIAVRLAVRNIFIAINTQVLRLNRARKNVGKEVS